MANIPTRIFPIGIEDFEDLRTNNYVYVDKTDLIYQLANTSRTCFLSRPRRFGKSLLLSTFKAYFEGKKHLFEGLAMERLEKEWTVHPVLQFSFSQSTYDDIDKLLTVLNVQLTQWERIYGSDPTEKTLSARFQGVIRRANEKTGQRVVILIDEYDSPLLDSTDDPKLRLALRKIAREFFSPLKFNTKIIRFLFITGITKFTQMSIFSELNSLDDISMWQEYSSLCGITENELIHDFKQDIEALAANNDETYEQAVAHLARLYDGYRFNHRGERVYNPFSVISVLWKKEYRSYWYSTGTPSFLLALLRKRNMPLMDMEGSKTMASAFDKSTDELTDPIPVLYQSGYLTIKDFQNGIYTLGYPNEEVRYGFLNSLLPDVLGHSEMENGMSLIAMKEALDIGDIDACLIRLRAFVASIPYEKKSDNESRFETIFYIIFTLMGQLTRTQVKTSSGRVDVVVSNKDYVYLFELKVDSTPEEALAQIDAKGYVIPYEADGRTVVKVGINYDKAMRGIAGWKAQ
ncbi:MAG: ATP-binding protein [Mediterranea sp.]|jgi:hypothetical protein|nr:ATP-binding protein [Mediterranea sp.]